LSRRVIDGRSDAPIDRHGVWSATRLIVQLPPAMRLPIPCLHAQSLIVLTALSAFLAATLTEIASHSSYGTRTLGHTG
jgi:hypothetical protein